jgi:hypothetical protein
MKGTTVHERQTDLTRNEQISRSIIPVVHLHRMGSLLELRVDTRTREAQRNWLGSTRKYGSGIWVYNGLFELIDCWTEESAGRRVFKFKLSLLVTDGLHRPSVAPAELEDDRLIPSSVKLEVWKRDQGRCRMCGSNSGLHFDHIIPYSKGGSSKNPANIQILWGRHNLAKGDNIE